MAFIAKPLSSFTSVSFFTILSLVTEALLLNLGAMMVPFGDDKYALLVIVKKLVQNILVSKEAKDVHVVILHD